MENYIYWVIFYLFSKCEALTEFPNCVPIRNVESSECKIDEIQSEEFCVYANVNLNEIRHLMYKNVDDSKGLSSLEVLVSRGPEEKTYLRNHVKDESYSHLTFQEDLNYGILVNGQKLDRSSDVTSVRIIVKGHLTLGWDKCILYAQYPKCSRKREKSLDSCQVWNVQTEKLCSYQKISSKENVNLFYKMKQFSEIRVYVDEYDKDVGEDIYNKYSRLDQNHFTKISFNYDQLNEIAVNENDEIKKSFDSTTVDHFRIFVRGNLLLSAENCDLRSSGSRTTPSSSTRDPTVTNKTILEPRYLQTSIQFLPETTSYFTTRKFKWNTEEKYTSGTEQTIEPKTTSLTTTSAYNGITKGIQTTSTEEVTVPNPEEGNFTGNKTTGSASSIIFLNFSCWILVYITLLYSKFKY